MVSSSGRLRRKRKEIDRSIPRAIRIAPGLVTGEAFISQLGKRRRKAAERFRAHARQIVDYADFMPRHREFDSVQKMFRWASVRPPQEIIAQKVGLLNGSRRCVVFEIGSGFGYGLGTMRAHPAFASIRHLVDFRGMDLVPRGVFPEIATESGDALRKPFPKADVIFSQVSAGYMGHIGFLVKKAADSLHPGGIAVLHINKYGNYDLHIDSAPILIKDMDKLSRNIRRLKIDGVHIRVRNGVFLSDGYRSPDDLVIVLEKNE